MGFGKKEKISSQTSGGKSDSAVELLRMVRISDEPQYNAFSDIAYFDNSFWIAYRTGKGHVSPFGKIIVRRSTDNGETWEKVDELTQDGIDLRDPRLKVINDRLYLVCFSLDYYDKKRNKFNTSDSYIYEYNVEGAKFERIFTFEYQKYRSILWGIAYSKGEFLLSSYRYERDSGDRPIAILWKSKSIMGPYTQVAVFDNHVIPPHFCYTEFDILQPADDRLLLLLRVDSYRKADKEKLIKRLSPKHNFTDWFVIGESKYPYDEWKLTPIRIYLKGPRGIVLPDGTTYVIGRYMKSYRTHYKKKSIMLYELRDNNLIPLLELAKGRDGSYAGFCIKPDEKDRLYISFYSDHERLGTEYDGKINDIWFAEIKLNRA